MYFIKALYRIPSIKEIFIILVSCDISDAEDKSKNKQRKQYLEHTLLAKEHTTPMPSQRWQKRLVALPDFLEVLKRHLTSTVGYPIQSSKTPDFDLLSMNMIKEPNCQFDPSFKTKKILCEIPSQDIIEVFI